MQSFESEFQPPQLPSPSTDAWQKFLTASSAVDLCHAWLEISCAQIPGVHYAAVLVKDAAAGGFVPIVVWPNEELDFASLSETIGQAIQEQKGVIHKNPASSDQDWLIAYPVKTAAGVESVVGMALTTTNPGQAMMLLHWNSAWLTNLLILRHSELDQTNYRHARKVIDCLTSLNHSKEVAQSLIELCAEIKAAVACDKVAIGTYGSARVKVRTITDSAHLEKNSHISKCYAAAMEAALDRDMTIQATREEPTTSNPHDPITQLFDASGNALLLVVPLTISGRKIGALTLEWQHAQLEEEHLKLIDAMRSILAPAIESRLRADQNSPQRLVYEAKQTFEKLLGPNHLVLKTATAMCIVPLVLSLLIHIPYRVTAKTVVEGEVQRTATAPFNGFISRSYFKAGDQLKKGQVLLELDTTELEIEKHKWQGERDQHNEKLQQAIAAQDLSEVQVASAQLKQSESQLSLTTERLARAKIRAPFDGIVISGDQSQQIGAPVETGKKLFEIAPLDRYRVILQVDERDIGSIRQGQQGKLIITGLAGEAMNLHISRITPVATAKDGKNYFRVEARLGDASIRLRPGMEGVGKIETPARSLFWIVTHKFSDWLRLTLWTWLP